MGCWGDTAGVPITGQIWVRGSPRGLREKPVGAGHSVSAPGQRPRLRLPRQRQKTEASSNHPDRDQQFDYIAVQRATFTAAGLPVLGVDTKKKELVGNFKNAGQAWGREPIAWKERLQVCICDRFGVTVTVCHYPTGCSKWNPIEHRLF
jgi:hypothetical protein